MAIHTPNGRKIHHNKHTNLFDRKTVQNLYKLGFFGIKIYNLTTVPSTNSCRGFDLTIQKLGLGGAAIAKQRPEILER
jgi:hypothetical protein